jgi:hypothetical protein
MKYFGLFSVLIAVSIGVVWSVNGLAPGGVSENGELQKAGYQDAIDSARDAADSISEAGTVKIEIYEGIEFAPNTIQVDISNQNLNGSLKAEIRKLTNLEMLDVSNNSFTGLPAEIGQLSRLKILNLSSNPLTGLPHEIGQLKNLEVLDVSGTDYSADDLAVIQSQLPESTEIIVD